MRQMGGTLRTERGGVAYEQQLEIDGLLGFSITADKLHKFYAKLGVWCLVSPVKQIFPQRDSLRVLLGVCLPT